MKYYFILNPTAGKGNRAEALENEVDVIAAFRAVLQAGAVG